MAGPTTTTATSGPTATYNKHQQAVTDLVNNFGGAKFSDILNRLWLMGVDPKELSKALATSNNGTNDPSDIVTRLLNNGTVTVDQLKSAPTVDVPNIPGPSWPFTDAQNGKDAQGKPLTVPVHTNPYTPQSPTGIPQAQINAPNGPQPTVPTNVPKTGATGGGKTVVTQTAPQTADTKKPIDTSTPEGIAEYEKTNFSNMLWVNDVPELKDKITLAAKQGWTPDRFQAEIQSTDWWKTHSDTYRKYVTMTADPETYKQNMQGQTDLINGYAAQYGITLTPDQVHTLADKSLQMGWNTDPKMLEKQTVNLATLDPNHPQGGALGANMETVRATARDYFTNVSDQDAFNMAKQLGMGDIDQATITGNMAQKAKAAWPSLANLIDQGVAPRQAMSNQIQTAAQLLEIDPNQVDPSQPKFQSMISATDPKSGVARPMTVDETSRFVKGMTDYWNTDNAKNEVSQTVSSLATMFGKQAI